MLPADAPRRPRGIAPASAGEVLDAFLAGRVSGSAAPAFMAAMLRSVAEDAPETAPPAPRFVRPVADVEDRLRG